MDRTEKRYVVNGVGVVLVRDETGARWECEACDGDCQHILQAAAMMTLQSWANRERPGLH
jgi:hypothetical protein